jgi:arginase
VIAVDLVTVPYDSGRRGYRMGAGPQALLRDGLVQKLRASGYDVELVPVETSGAAKDDLSIAFDLAARVARVVRASRSAGRFPLTISGSCFSTVGAFACVADEPAGVLWLDAHGDLNTPDTSESGFLDGMAAATLLGWCHADRTGGLPSGILAESAFMLVGARDFDAAESAALKRSAATLLTPAEAIDPGTRAAALQAFAAPLKMIYLHVDLDVLDPEQVGRVNEFASPRGLSLKQVVDLLQAAGSILPIAGMTMSAYDPAFDADGAVRRAATDIIMAVLQAAEPATTQ